MSKSRSKSTPAAVFDRRTLSVLAALVGTLTVVSGLLLVLEPSQAAPGPGPVLTVVQSTPTGLDSLFATEATLDTQRWSGIVVHHSGAAYGNAQTLAAADQARGLRGLGHHFIIGNGNGAADGEIQTGFRWTRQFPGAHMTPGEAGDWFNHHAISICIIGNSDQSPPTDMQMEQLVRLVNALQRRLDIPADRVVLAREYEAERGPGLLFPATTFRQQLLSPRP